ncbi:aquaporin [Roseiconus nitratireducens]|uniref:Aquaporin n=1 Tax=Roseiconus nitratireducens TaxID=2605748 RepID=A0A5M6CY66_9BACT|nr:aquaporin [Roseiconus nitratireducens]KAA5540043.1 aquaporin [Roseiconus nitratireducens]
MALSLSKRFIAEVVGTYALVLFGCGAMAVDADTGVLTHVGVALTWGLVVMVMIFSIGKLSGAHMNPAVSIAFTVHGRLPGKDCFAYVIAQCIGAIAAAASIRAVVGINQADLGATTTDLHYAAGLGVEFMMSAALMMVVMGVSTGAKEESITAAIAVGATIAMEAMVAGPLTKASMNPARSLGPALVSGVWDHFTLYLAGPIFGAIAGALLYRIMSPTPPPSDAASDTSD